MTNDFATGMRRALEKYRAIDPAVATSLVQEVLGANGIALPGGLDRQPTRALLENPFSSLMRDRCQPSAGGGLVQGLNLPGLSGRPAGCQSASNRDPLSASNIDPSGAELARRCVVPM